MNYDKGPKKIFISSTCLDLIDVRAELKRELETLGYVAYTSETNDFPVDPQIMPIDNCLDVVRSCDIYLLVIHSRYGGQYDGERKLPNVPDKPPGGHVSVTLAELLIARDRKLETRIWVRDSIWNSRPVFRGANSEATKPGALPTAVEPEVYDFLDFLQNNSETGRLWINQFHDITDLKSSVTTWLKEKEYSNELQFKDEVANLFRLQGFDLNSEELLKPSVRRVLAHNPNDSFETEFAIWTYYHPANRVATWTDLQSTILQIKDDLSLDRYEKAFLIASGGYASDVVDGLRDRRLHKDVKLKSYNELLGGLINFNSYIRRIVHDYEHFEEFADSTLRRDPVVSIMRRCNLFKFFVPLRARVAMNSRRKFDGELETYVLGWLEEDGRNHLTILGDFGTGKSSFALWLTYTLAQKIEKDGWHTHRVPVFVSLRDHAGKIDVREIITNTLINNYDIRNADFKSFERLLEAGRLLIILDGFDETATLTDRANTLRILRGLNSLVRRNSKVILTCRSHYFRTDEETQSELNRSLNREETELFAEQKGKDNFEVVQLREFRRDQIELFLERHYDGDREKAKSTLSKMQATYNLTDLSRRPVMLEMILKVWPRLLEKSKDVEVTPSLLYNEYVDAWIDKVAKGNEDLMDPATKRSFCQDLTKWMYRENREMLPYTEIEKVVKEYFKDRPPAVYAALDTEVRTCTFLNRDSVGNYQFAHRSFMEFFVAMACAEEFRTKQYELLKLRPLSPEITNFLRGLIEDSELLWSALKWTRSKGLIEAGNLGGNAATLLALMDQSFQGANLEATVVLDADLTNIDLSDADLSHAILHRSRLFNATLDGSDFRYADLTAISIGELGAISCLAWSNDGDYLAIGGEDFNVRVLDYTNRKFGALFRGHGATIVDLAFIPQLNLLCSVADNVIVWDINKGSMLLKTAFDTVAETDQFTLNARRPFITITGANEAFVIKLGTFKRQSFYSNVTRFSVELQHMTRIVVKDWSKSGAEVFRSKEHQGAVTTAAFSPTDSVIAVGTTERKVYVWDSFTGALIAIFEGKPVSCKGMKIEGAKGLNSGGYYVQQNTAKGTLGEWLIERGADWPRLKNITDRMHALLLKLIIPGTGSSLDDAAEQASQLIKRCSSQAHDFQDDNKILEQAIHDRERFLSTTPLLQKEVDETFSLIEKTFLEKLANDLPDQFKNAPKSQLVEVIERLRQIIADTTYAYEHYYTFTAYLNLAEQISCIRQYYSNDPKMASQIRTLKDVLNRTRYNWPLKHINKQLDQIITISGARYTAQIETMRSAQRLVGWLRECDLLSLEEILTEPSAD
ncbi:MAG TPA: DUF4062 domain-containing protein [Pyrinomonadaceae bacterium]|nr:DUF4062 domain-containing protein [Pyrinomonadaceae bacterium]